MVKRYAISNGEAGMLAQMLQEKYRLVPAVRVVPLGPNELMVSAPVADHFDIAAILVEGVGNPKLKIINLRSADAFDLEDTLKGIFGDKYKSPKSPYVEARDSSSLILHGTDEQITELEAAIKRLDVPFFLVFVVLLLILQDRPATRPHARPGDGDRGRRGTAALAQGDGKGLEDHQAGRTR